MRRTTTAAALVTAALALAGCSGTPEAEAPSASPSPTVAVATAPPPPAPPAVGSCHVLDVRSATEPVDDAPAVPCRQEHTSVTIAVGQIRPLSDGHLLAVDSPAVRAQLARACPRTLAGYVGGDETARRLSRLEVVWFGPTLEQADAGANWYRCDVVGLRSEGRLLPLPARMKGALGREGALDRFGTCGTTAPGKPGFARVACSERHAWRAVDVLAIAQDARYLGKEATAAGDRACQDVASARAGDSLTYSWSFEWPTREQWAGGQRHGLCWVPEG